MFANTTASWPSLPPPKVLKTKVTKRHELRDVAGMLNTKIVERSAGACQVVLPLPAPPSSESGRQCVEYLSALAAITTGLGPTALVRNGESIDFVSQAI